MTHLQEIILIVVLIGVIVVNFALNGVEKELFNNTYNMAFGAIW